MSFGDEDEPETHRPPRLTRVSEPGTTVDARWCRHGDTLGKGNDRIGTQIDPDRPLRRFPLLTAGIGQRPHHPSTNRAVPGAVGVRTDWTQGTITKVTGSLGASGRNAMRAGSVIVLAGVVILVAGLVTALDWLSRLGISFVTVGLGTALSGAAFRRTAASLTRGRTITTRTSEQRPRDQDEAHPASDGPKNDDGWLDRAIGQTDTSRMLDYEIKQREKSRKRQHGPSDPDGGRTGYDRGT
jgi:hypothetical protein